MSDRIALHVAGRRIDRFLSYRVEADIYTADDAFRLTFADPGIAIDPGMRCELYIGDSLELTGIIDRVEDGEEKSGSTLTATGRDLMGLLVDSYCETFPDLENITLKALAEELLKNVPYINRKAIRYQAGIAGAQAAGSSDASPLAGLGLGQKNAHVEPGKTVFEVLSEYAVSRGGMFFSLPDGTLVFGRPKAAGQPAFRIVHRLDGNVNNAVKATRIRDISQRHSKITVIGQQQGDDLLSAEAVNTEASVEDPEVPFYKPYVAQNNNDAQSPAEHARMILERKRSSGLQLIYRAPGHSQEGRNWTINELCHVTDEKRGIDGTYLIYGRAFELSKKDGRFTDLYLGLPGVIR